MTAAGWTEGLGPRQAEPSTRSEPAPRRVRPVSGSRKDKYLLSALERECEGVRSQAEPGRNIRLNNAALALGQLIAGEGLDENMVVSELKAAARACGLGEVETKNTIASGLAAGKKEPRHVPESNNYLNNGAANDDNGEPPPGRFDDDGVAMPPEVKHESVPYPTFEWIDVGGILAEPIPDASWVVPGMEIGPGRPCSIVGIGGSGKSWDAMELGCAVASGTKAFGHFEVTRGRVSHISHELGRRPVKERYRRLANGRHMQLEDFAQNLRIACLPRLFLNSPGAEAEYMKQFDGCALVIIDSLRRAVPGADENASEMSNYLDILNRVSERTGAAFLYIHHMGKGEQDDKRLAGRGSTAIMDGSGCIWLLEGSGNGPRRMTQTRAHDDGDGECPPFYVVMERVATPEPAFVASLPAVRLVRQDDAEVGERVAVAQARRANEKYERARRAAVELVRSSPGLSQVRLARSLAETKLVGEKAARALLDELVADKWIDVSRGEHNAFTYTLGKAWRP